MQNLPLDKQLLLALNEAFDKRRLFAVSFALISTSIVVIGLLWPKTYESSTTLLWNNAQTLTPLLAGTAVTNTGSEQIGIAREVIYSNKNLETLIEKAELNVLDDGKLMSSRDVEVLKARLRDKIIVESQGQRNIIGISYRSSRPEEAYLVVSIISNLFIDETTQNKKSDSYKAYEFIEKQVNEYQAKLEEISSNINEFKAQNVAVQVDTTKGVSDRVNSLRQDMKTTSLELKESEIQKESLVEQLLAESRKGSQIEVENVKSERLVLLEDRLSMLRLSYTDTYPDIIQLKEQIKTLKESLNSEPDNQSDRDLGSAGRIGGISFRSPLYDQLEKSLLGLETRIKTLRARKADQELQLAQEIARSSEVNAVVSRLEDLSRDYQVTKTLYDRLLTNRENARVSLNLELESAGSLFTVHEPPIVPLVPVGLRFLHFSMVSVVAGFAIPLGAVFGLLLIDPRVRHEDELGLSDDFAVIGVVPGFKIAADYKRQRFISIQSVIIFILSMVIIVGLSLSRYFEVI